MKRINFYVLYDMNDFPVLYFPTLKEFCLALNYSYKYLSNKFSNFNTCVDLNIQGKNFKLYKFID